MRASSVTRMEVVPIAVSIPQAAQMIGRGIATIYDLLGRKEIEGIKSDGRSLIKVSSLQAYIDRCQKMEIAPRPKRKPPQHLRNSTAPPDMPPAEAIATPTRKREPKRRVQAEAATS
jgi:hypothetical protein